MPDQKSKSHPEIFPRYQAYLLRLWQEQPGTQWRVLLQEVDGEKQWGFSDSAQCFEFIENELHKDQT